MLRKAGHGGEEGFVAGQDSVTCKVRFGVPARGQPHLEGAVAMFVQVEDGSSELCGIFGLDHEAATGISETAASFTCGWNCGDDRPASGQVGEEF